MVRIIKCPNCGIYNENVEYCTNCDTLLSYKKRREIAFAREKKERLVRERIADDAAPSFYEKHKDHRFLIVRAFVKMIHSIWLGFMAVGIFIAWLITAIAA
jgi:hypothetical protein